jgi:hypothetical protein
MTRKRNIAGALKEELTREIKLSPWGWFKLTLFLTAILATLLLPWLELLFEK